MSAVSILDDRGSVLKTIHTDGHEGGRMVEVMTQELDPIIAHAKWLREVRGTRTQDFEEGMVVAGFVPDFAVEQMIRKCGHFPTEDMIKQWLNDPQNDCFRVWKGRV